MVAKRVPERRPLPGYERIECVEACDVRGLEHSGVEAATSGHPVQLEEEDIQTDQRKPEGRHRDSSERDKSQTLKRRSSAFSLIMAEWRRPTSQDRDVGARVC